MKETLFFCKKNVKFTIEKKELTKTTRIEYSQVIKTT